MISNYASDIFKNMIGALIVGVVSVLGTVGAINANMSALKEDVYEIKTSQANFSKEFKSETKEADRRIRNLELLHARDLTPEQVKRFLSK